MPNEPPHILLVNPWIHDFAAYDFWAKPYGLLQLAAILRAHGLKISYRDCLDRFHPRAPRSDPGARYGRGPYRRTRIPAPAGLADTDRQYSRYGIEPDWFRQDLVALTPPDLVLVTSLMTYWYPGVQETIAIIREMFPAVPIVLGGIYATLCQTHAKAHAGADEVAPGVNEANILELVNRFTGWHARPTYDPADLDTYPYPAFDLQNKINYIAILTSRGCPFHCAYCASGILFRGYRTRGRDHVVAEIAHWHHTHGVRDFAFYDDALLVNAETHAIPLLEQIVTQGFPIRFHTPNALHIRGITATTAQLMYQAGFKTIRLGLETYRDASRADYDRKTTAVEFKRAVSHLRAAGFHPQQVGAYLLVGLPDQDRRELETSIQLVRDAGVTPVLAHYTPIPRTRLWPRAVATSRYDLAADPVFTNNAISPCQQTPFSWETMSRLKRLAADKG